jgi:TadE-like protein
VVGEMPPRVTGGSRRWKPADEGGVALVEFALVLPLILLLLFGMIDFGKAFNYWNDETHLSAEAARAAAVNRCPDCGGAKINTWIKGLADSSELRNGSTSVSPPGLGVCIWFPDNSNPLDDPARDHARGDPVEVVVSARYNWLGYLVGRGLTPSSVITSRSRMRIEKTYNADGNDAYRTGPLNAQVDDASGTC